MLHTLKKYFDEDIYGIFLSVLLTIAVSLQILIVVAAIFSFIPIKLDSSLDTVLPQVLALFRPEREMAFYQFFVALTVMVHVTVIALFKDRWRDPAFQRSLKQFLVMEYIWIGLLVFAVFKILIYKGPLWAKILFYVVLTLSIAGKVFWIELKVVSPKIWRWLIRLRAQPRFVRAWDVLFIVVVLVFLWVPDPQAALGRIVALDQLFHLDMFLVSPALAQLKGAVLNVDVFSPLGVAVPFLVGKLAQALGGFNYEHVLQALVLLSALYCAGAYAFLRLCFRSIGLAVFGTLLFIKLHFFHAGVAPLIWAFPEHTVIRSLFDLAVLFFLWKHAQGGRFVDLVWAAVALGWSIAYMPDTGLYQTLAFYGYLIVRALLVRGEGAFAFPRDLRKLFLTALVPWVIALIILFLFQKTSVFSPVFWQNSGEFMNALWQGIGNTPVYSGLKGRQFFAVVMGLGIPVFFMLSALVISFAVSIREASAKNLWIVALCFYGLGCHWYFVNRSEATLYYAHALPLVVVACFWIDLILKRWSTDARRLGLLVLMSAALAGLLTNNSLISYPNALNISGHNWSKEKTFFKAQTTFDADVRLIERLTTKTEAVALVSSFATKILSDAARRPLFYYSPVMVSSLMTANDFRGTTIYSTARMFTTLGQLETKKPPLVFIENRLNALAVPKDYENYIQSWLILKNYLTNHYDVIEQGQYLQVLKRKP